MVRKIFSPEQTNNKLRKAQIHIDQGISIASHLDDFTTRDDLSQCCHRQAATVNFRLTR